MSKRAGEPICHAESTSMLYVVRDSDRSCEKYYVEVHFRVRARMNIFEWGHIERVEEERRINKFPDHTERRCEKTRLQFN